MGSTSHSHEQQISMHGVHKKLQRIPGYWVRVLASRGGGLDQWSELFLTGPPKTSRFARRMEYSGDLYAPVY